MATHPHEPHRARRGPSAVQVIGILLLVPLTIAWLIGQVLPTLATVGLSLMETTALTGRSRFTGLTNYGSILSDHQFADSLRFTLLGVLALVVAVAILPPLLAAAAVSFSPAVRLPLRLLFSLPLATSSPIAIAITLGGLSRADLSDPGTAATTLIRTEALYAFLIASGIGLITYVAALRTGAGRGTLKALTARPVLAVWAVTVVGTAAWALQSFAVPYVVTGGGPARATTTLALYEFVQAFRNFDFGVGSAASTVELILLTALGMVCGLIVVISRVRLTITSAAPGSGRRPALAVAVTVLCTILLLAGVLPMIGNTFAPAQSYARVLRGTVGLAMWHTVWPTVPQVVVVLALVTVAAAGIGLFRPLGAHSEWLLLPFSPWLFVTTQPLSPAAYLDFVRPGGPVAAVTTLWPVQQFAIPALFVLTLLFTGLAPRWHDARARGTPDALLGTALLPALPVILLLGALLAWIGFHDLAWPLVSTTQVSSSNGTIWIVLLRNRFGVDANILHAALTLVELPLVIVFVIIHWTFQALFADRLALDAG